LWQPGINEETMRVETVQTIEADTAAGTTPTPGPSGIDWFALDKFGNKGPGGHVCEPATYRSNCPTRPILDQVADKWSMLILYALADGPQRFNVLKRRLEGITQKALTQTLRKLERNGLIVRRVLETSPIAVEYEMTVLGGTLRVAFRTLYDWTHEHLEHISAAQAAFDAKHGGAD
jgi:DNA-binding HxlR family transcriptional regulator